MYILMLQEREDRNKVPKVHICIKSGMVFSSFYMVTRTFLIRFIDGKFIYITVEVCDSIMIIMSHYNDIHRTLLHPYNF